MSGVSCCARTQWYCQLDSALKGFDVDRVARLLSTSNRASKILEIGASHAPIAPKSAGWNSFVVDHLPRDELRAKFTGHDVNLDAIEEVDAIWQNGPLHESIPALQHGTFDTLIASHVIEHMPDFAGFFISAEKLLSPTGSIALAVPDRRYCFDYFKPPSMTGDVLEAHVSGRSRHAMHSIWNHIAYSAKLDEATAWGQHPVSRPTFCHSFAEADGARAGFDPTGSSPYIDCHTWHFTPSSFCLVILELGQLGIMDWKVDSLYGPEGCEFLVHLRRGAARETEPATLQRKRMELLEKHLVETREQLDFALGSYASPVRGRLTLAWMGAAALPRRVVRRLRRTVRL